MRLAGLVGVGLTIATVGCARDSQTSTLGSGLEVPVDFALAVTVFAPASADRNSRVPVSRRPARYVLEPDRVLKASTGPGSDERTYPPRVRQLTREEFDRVWEMTRESNALSPEESASVGSPETFVPPRGRTCWLISTCAFGKRTSAALEPASASGADGAGAGRLVDELARLAWVDAAGGSR